MKLGKKKGRLVPTCYPQAPSTTDPALAARPTYIIPFDAGSNQSIAPPPPRIKWSLELGPAIQVMIFLKKC